MKIERFLCEEALYTQYNHLTRFADKTIQNWQVGDAQRSLQIDDPYLKKVPLDKSSVNPFFGLFFL